MAGSGDRFAGDTPARRAQEVFEELLDAMARNRCVDRDEVIRLFGGDLALIREAILKTYQIALQHGEDTQEIEPRKWR